MFPTDVLEINNVKLSSNISFEIGINKQPKGKVKTFFKVFKITKQSFSGSLNHSPPRLFLLSKMNPQVQELVTVGYHICQS